MKPTLQQNHLNILVSFLKEVISWRLQNTHEPFQNAPKIAYESMGNSLPATFIKTHELSQEESVILLLALIPHLLPEFLLEVVTDEFPNGIELPIFGGVKGKNHRGILPTGETVQFILGGKIIEHRLEVLSFFDEQHFFHQKEVLYLESVAEGEPLLSGKLLLKKDMMYVLTTGIVPPPKLSTDFPAEKLETPLGWEDLVLNDKTLQQVQELEVWLQHNATLMEDWGMAKRLKPGYRALFYGPPGTGKTLTASLLGKYTQKPVYRIDLSTVVSKYIGETEKHLSNLFDRASHKDWILFFDEADAIFGKRTNVRDAHDKYANQEVSYLLQRVESHPGLVILASNFRDNIDEAFTRRFQSLCAFELPGVKERKHLWEKNLPKQVQLGKEVDLEQVARKFDLSGSNIVNIIHFCGLQLLKQNSTTLSKELLWEGVKREYIKEDRIF